MGKIKPMIDLNKLGFKFKDKKGKEHKFEAKHKIREDSQKIEFRYTIKFN